MPQLNPTTVVVAPAPVEFSEARSINELTSALSNRTVAGEHSLVDQGAEALPITLINCADTARPAAVVIPLDSSAPMRIEATRWLLRVISGGAPVRAPDSLTAQQRRRLGLILRGLDARLADYSYRAIANVLFGCTSTGADWRSHDLRGRTIRICRRGFDLMHGEYLNLLRYPRQFRG